jgi:hypothetical protein
MNLLKMKIIKNYTLIFEDKQGNELKRINIYAKCKKEANKLAKIYKSASQLNDLNNISVWKIEK